VHSAITNAGSTLDGELWRAPSLMAAGMLKEKVSDFAEWKV
jgi:hypothetical protein